MITKRVVVLKVKTTGCCSGYYSCQTASIFTRCLINDTQKLTSRCLSWANIGPPWSTMTRRYVYKARASSRGHLSSHALQHNTTHVSSVVCQTHHAPNKFNCVIVINWQLVMVKVTWKYSTVKVSQDKKKPRKLAKLWVWVKVPETYHYYWRYLNSFPI